MGEYVALGLQIAGFLRGRINVLDLLENTPMNIAHELYRNAFLQSKADEEKQKSKSENEQEKSVNGSGIPSSEAINELQEILEEGG